MRCASITLPLLYAPLAGSGLQHALEGEVLGATSSASFKLIFICSVVGWMLNTGRLPTDTSRVLTQVVPHLHTSASRWNCVAAECDVLISTYMLLTRVIEKKVYAVRRS